MPILPDRKWQLVLRKADFDQFLAANSEAKATIGRIAGERVSYGAPHLVNDTGKVAHRANVHSIVGTGRDRPSQLDKGRGDARSWTIHSWRS